MYRFGDNSDMLSVDGDADAAVETMDGINSGSW